MVGDVLNFKWSTGVPVEDEEDPELQDDLSVQLEEPQLDIDDNVQEEQEQQQEHIVEEDILELMEDLPGVSDNSEDELDSDE